MMPLKHLNIAVIGDEDLVNGLRLGGLSRYYVINDNRNAAEDVRKAFSSLINKPEIGIVAIQEDYIQYVEDLKAKLEQDKRITPLIIDLPPKSGTKYPDVTKYYKEYIRKFIGFEVEI